MDLLAAVDLTCSGLPAGAVCVFNPASLPTGTSALTITTTAATPIATSNITVTGTSGSLTHTTTISLTVRRTLTPDFTSYGGGALRCE